MCYHLSFSFISFFLIFCLVIFGRMLLFTRSFLPSHAACIEPTALFCSLSQCYVVSRKWFPRVFKNFKIQTSLDFFKPEVWKKWNIIARWSGWSQHCCYWTKECRSVCSYRGLPREQKWKIFIVQGEKTHFCMEF